MILVIADDLTGANEIAGTGISFGLKSEINIYPYFNRSCRTEIQIICTDSRSVDKDAAKNIIVNIANEIHKIKNSYSFIYIKIDSVLRGYVGMEINLFLEKLRFKRSIIIPANPTKNRIIYNGKYFVDGVELNKTKFEFDPEFPRKLSDVIKLINYDDNYNVRVISDEIEFSEHGNFVGNAIDFDDVLYWAKLDYDNTLLCGAVDFFNALILCRFQYTYQLKDLHIDIFANNSKIIYILGSPFHASKFNNKFLFNEKFYFLDLNKFDKYKNYVIDVALDVIEIVDRFNVCIIAIDNNVTTEISFKARVVRLNVSLIVSYIFKLIDVDELIIEGGSTAGSIMKQLGINCIHPTTIFENGIVRSSVSENPTLNITLKPGSYIWPKIINPYAVF